MRLIALVALTATAAWVAPAAAQTVPDPNPYYGVSPDPNAPPPRHRPPAGTTWQAPPARMQGPPQVYRAPMGPERRVEYRRIDRGGVVPERWRGQDVQVRDWHRYGFPAPAEGGRWIRYYDDALMVDGDGRVRDSRPGWDWDRYGDRWAEDGDGVPVYAGNGDFQPGRRDYEWAERFGSGRPHVETRTYVERGPMGPPMAPPPPPPCMPGCGGGYGYAYGGYGGGVVVTETTVTEAPVVEQRTYVTYETVRVRVPVRHRRHIVRRCTCRVAAPPPPPGGGERG